MDIFDITDPGFLAYMESEGMMDTSEGLVAKVAAVLRESPNEVIDREEFRQACHSVGVDPDSFTERDFQRLQEMLG